MAKAYYNEIDPYAAQWLRNLIQAGHIANGDVDERSIKDVTTADLTGYTQCHFFAGIGIWSLALRRAGWQDDRPVWTGSCPCQPFSVAGARKGTEDERHLWPEWYRLIKEQRPPIVFGEQVDAAIRHGWLDLVSSNLENAGYAVGAACVPAGCVGAAHIRQRLFFVAELGNATGNGCKWERASGTFEKGASQPEHSGQLSNGLERSGLACRMADNGDAGLQRRLSRRAATERQIQHGHSGCDGTTGELGNTSSKRFGETRVTCSGYQERVANAGSGGATDENYGLREPVDWLLCRDGYWRPVEPGTFPLVDGDTGRVGRLRAYGNAIDAGAAEAFIAAFLETRP